MPANQCWGPVSATRRVSALTPGPHGWRCAEPLDTRAPPVNAQHPRPWLRPTDEKLLSHRQRDRDGQGLQPRTKKNEPPMASSRETRALGRQDLDTSGRWTPGLPGPGGSRCSLPADSGQEHPRHWKQAAKMQTQAEERHGLEGTNPSRSPQRNSSSLPLVWPKCPLASNGHSHDASSAGLGSPGTLARPVPWPSWGQALWPRLWPLLPGCGGCR